MTEPTYTAAVHDPHGRAGADDVAVRRSAVIDSILGKQTQMPQVDHNGQPITNAHSDADELPGELARPANEPDPHPRATSPRPAPHPATDANRTTRYASTGTGTGTDDGPAAA